MKRKKRKRREEKKAEVSEWESEQETFQFASTGFFSDRRCENRHRRGYTRSVRCVVDRCDDTHTHISDCVSDGRNSDKLYTTTMFAPNVFVLQGVSTAHMAHFRDNKTKDCWRGKKKSTVGKM